MATPKAIAAYKAWREAEESQSATILVEEFGVGWDFPAAMPARLWLWCTSRDSTNVLEGLTLGDVDELAEMAVPASVRDEWLSLPGLSRDEYHSAVVRAVVRYLYPDRDRKPSGEAAESTSQTSSSETSGSSTPTSPANTLTDTPEDSGPSSKPG